MTGALAMIGALDMAGAPSRLVTCLKRSLLIAPGPSFYDELRTMQDEGHLVQLRADVNSLEYRSAHARKRACFRIDARGMLPVWGD